MKHIGKLKVFKSSEIKESYVSIGFECLDRDMFKPEKCYDLLAETGIKYARCQTGWSKTEKTPGVYDFAWLDDVVDNLLSRGIQPWFNVGSGNPIYMKDNLPNPTAVGCVPLYYGDEVYEAWLNFVTALAKHYKGRVEHYEIWNEPDNHHHWYPEKINVMDYIKLVKDCRDIIKEINPEAKLGANVAGLSRLFYFEEFAQNIGKNVIDFLCVHPYTTVPEASALRRFLQIKRICKKNGLDDVELWQGEAGYPSWAYEGHWLLPNGGNSERAQAIWQLRRYFIDVYQGIKRSSFFQAADMWEKPYAQAVTVIAKPAAQGILNGLTYTPKKSYETISYLSALFTDNVEPEEFYADVSFWAENVCEFVSTQVMTFRKNGFPMCAYYLPSDVAKENTQNYTCTVEMYDKIDEPVLVDMYTSDVYEIESGVSESRNITYENLPLKDYPLVITDKKAIDII